jgi:hypothetical protein
MAGGAHMAQPAEAPHIGIPVLDCAHAMRLPRHRLIRHEDP